MNDNSDMDPMAAALAEIKRGKPGIPEADLLRFLTALITTGDYQPCPEATPREGVAPGTLRSETHIARSGYTGLSRQVQVYLPAAATDPLCLTVIQDGSLYLGPEVNASVVFDNLIAAGEIPPTVVLFVDPGTEGPGLPIYGGDDNRSIEYDSLGSGYADFLINELIPEFTDELAMVSGPEGRAICGMSSGGICAFNAAWERPDYFSKVISHCGSFVDIRGGHALIPAVRRAPAKPLRIFLQTGEHDLDIIFGNWPLANRAMAAALEYRGYDYQFEYGNGGHSLAHAGATFADALRWLWRDWRGKTEGESP